MAYWQNSRGRGKGREGRVDLRGFRGLHWYRGRGKVAQLQDGH